MATKMIDQNNIDKKVIGLDRKESSTGISSPDKICSHCLVSI